MVKAVIYHSEHSSSKNPAIFMGKEMNYGRFLQSIMNPINMVQILYL